MSEKDNGGPAFPFGKTSEHDGRLVNSWVSEGMTLRDYFAAKAMQGYLANAWQAQELDSMGESSGEQMAIVAEISYAMADAMLKARKA